MKKDFLARRNYIAFSGELHSPERYVTQTDFLVGLLAPIINVYRLSAETFADLGRPLNCFWASLLPHKFVELVNLPSMELPPPDAPELIAELCSVRSRPVS
jgi:hypothetical protein